MSAAPQTSLAGQVPIEGGIIGIDLATTPNEVPLIDPGVYTFLIREAKVEPNRDSTGMNSVISLEVETGLNDAETTQKGRRITDYIAIDPDPKSPSRVRLRHLILAANGTIDRGGVNIPGLAEKRVTAEIVHRPDKNDKTKFYANIKDYVVPAEVLAANPVQQA